MSETKHTKYLEILNNNKGFIHPEKWVDYATKNNFEKIDAVRISICPDCKSNKQKKLGQYIYYSNLIQILRCNSCGLIFSDVRLGESVIKHHFEVSYKDDQYYKISRNKIFFQIACIVKNYLHKERGTVLDIGGAKGHLASLIKMLCNGVDITISDLSVDACNSLTSKGFKTICCSLAELRKHINRCYDIVLLIDVLYYEPNLKEALKSIQKSVDDKGVIIIRIPNKLWLIRSVLLIKRSIYSKQKLEMSDNVKFVNSEHIYFFSRKYLTNRFKNQGFNKINFYPAKPLHPKGKIKKTSVIIFFMIANCIYYMSFRKLIITPSQLVIVSK